MDMAFSLNDNFAEEDIGEPYDTPQGNCRRCNKNSTLMCLRCGDCYCSKKCQDLEWPQHRYICFPKPPLVKMNTVHNEDDIPEHGFVEPVHLKEQLRIMADVCREFMQQLEKTSDWKTDNLKSPITNGNSHLNNTSNFDDIPATGETSFNNNNNNNFNNNKPIKRNNYNNRNNEQKPKSLIYCPANEKIKIRPPPPLVDSDLSSMSSSKSDAGNIEDQVVYLTSFRSSNRVGVCPQKYENDGSYQKILEQVDNYGRNAKTLEQVPEPDTYVLALRAGKYSRGKVMSQKEPTNTTRIRLDFIDYGNLAYRKLTELREITTELKNLPIYTKIVQLTKVDLIVYDEAFLRFLSGLEKKFYKLKNVPGPPTNSITVELYDLESGEKMNEHISKYCSNINAGKSTPSSSSSSGQTNKFRGKNRNSIPTKQKDDNESDISSIKNRPFRNSDNSLNEKNNNSTGNSEIQPILKAPFEEHIFPLATRNQKAVILDVSLVEHGYIPCMFEEHKPALNQIQTYLAQCEKSDVPYKPKYGEYVIALFEDDWYRGKVIGVLPNNKFEISYIDFLNEAILSIAEIRRYPEELTIDCYATLCVISGLPKSISPEIKEFLKTEISINDVIQINRVVEIADGRVAWIECHEIMDRMYEKNLI